MVPNTDPLAHARLLRAARRYEALASDLRMFLWVMDPHLRPTGPNAAWEEYTGQSREHYLELGWLDAIADGDRDRCLREIERNVPREQPFALELAIRRRDGVYRRHAIRAIPVRDEHGILTEWLGTATDVEADRSTADELRSTEQRFWLTHDASGVGTWEWLPERSELRWSEQTYRLLGLEPGEITPSLQAWTSAMHPDDVRTTTEQWTRALQESDTISSEFRIVHGDGSARWISSRATVVRDDAGKALRVIGVNIDVTERRAMEEEMRLALAEHRELRERLVALTDGAEAVLRADTLNDVRRAICELAARVLPADAYAVWSFDTATSVWHVVHSVGLPDAFVSQRHLGTEVPFTEPLVADDLQLDLLAHRAASYREAGIRSLISVPLPIDGVRRGTVVAYYRIPHETTKAEVQVAVALGHLAAAAISNAEARARQEAMRADTERHSRRMAFLAEASTLLAALDFEASFRRLAELAVPSLGDWCAIDVERDGVLARVAVTHLDPALVSVAQRMHDRFPVHRDGSSGVARVLRSGQSELHSEITDEMIAAAAHDREDLATLRALTIRSAILAPIVARGRTLGVLTLVSSTDERRYDETDLAFVEEVARRAAMAIDNARLYEDARRANRAKDEFLALLSHELRTPLNAVMGWTQVLLNPPTAASLDAQHRRGLEIIRRNAKLQAELVDGLLDVARVATGGLPLTLQPVDAGDAAASAIEAIRPVAAERGLQVRLVVEATGCRALADPNRFQQILSNLLSNALKFTHAGDQIEVTVRQVESWCEIEVADTGAGIAPEFLPHVFERFRQADSSTTRRHGGLGLGLWLVQELVRAHSGTITASSAGSGGGSSFIVRLPVSE